MSPQAAYWCLVPNTKVKKEQTILGPVLGLLNIFGAQHDVAMIWSMVQPFKAGTATGRVGNGRSCESSLIKWAEM